MKKIKYKKAVIPVGYIKWVKDYIFETSGPVSYIKQVQHKCYLPFLAIHEPVLFY